MMQHWLLREPSLSFGLPVYLFAALLVPLHLGWTGRSLPEFLAYLAVAALIFSIADALTNRGLYDSAGELAGQVLLSLLALALPAALAFAAGSLAGPVDEVLDEETCATQGAAESDTLESESDDTFDVTPDCVEA
jgi:hypothetical protein